MEKAEAGAAQLSKVEDALAEGAEKEAELIAEFKAKGGELQNEIAALKKARDKFARQLDASTLARYESLRASKHGIAVGVLTGSLCSACRTQIPAGEAQSIQAGPEIAECPNCKRILIVKAAE
jgi:predicted  nucleic acid-binding Zn-ribbon protein